MVTNQLYTFEPEITAMFYNQAFYHVHQLQNVLYVKLYVVMHLGLPRLK